MTTYTGRICFTAILCLLLSGCEKRPGSSDEALTTVMVSNGMTEADVTAALGEPKGTFSGGSTKTLMYDGVQIKLVDGKVVELPDDISEQLRQGRIDKVETDAFIAKQKKKGLILHDGKWMKPKERDQLIKQPGTANMPASGKNRRQSVYIMKDRQGNPISHNVYIRRGQVTVLDFYADWCGPCRRMDPDLKALVRRHGVTLKKVDIVNWESSTAERYNVKSVPNVRVFDRNGNMVGPPTSSLRTIESYIIKAKKQ